MQGLCCLDSQGTSAWPGVEQFINDSRESSLLVDRAMMMLRKAFDARPVSDELLARHARKWELHRLALVDRNILRLATWELTTDHAPSKVVISESLKLAKEFSTSESPRFINGVLDAIVEELSHAKPSPKPDGKD
jgi:transcription antitermination protein NusB